MFESKRTSLYGASEAGRVDGHTIAQRDERVFPNRRCTTHSLRQTALVEVREEGRERHYRTEPFKVGIITAGEPQLTMIIPTIIAAIGQQVADDDVSQFVEEYGVERLINVVAYVKPYIDGRMIERLATRELDLPTIVGTTILIALEDTVREMQELDPFFGDLRDATEDDGRQPSHEIQFDDNTRVVFEQNESE